MKCLIWLACLWVTTVSVPGGEAAGGEEPGSLPTTRPIVIREDVHIRERVEWRNGQYEIHGNVVLHQGGELIVEDATVSLMCTYTRQFSFQWLGGRLVTHRVTIGGAMHEGVAYQTVFEIQSGAWESEDTTIRYSSGVCMGWQGLPVTFHATRLRKGPHPDSIIMSCAPADVVLRDSEFDISLSASAAGGGRGQLELPVDEPISRVFDETDLPGVRYRLELVNTTVSLWWIFLSGVSTAGPPAEIVLGECPRLIPCILAYNLQGTFSLPAPWPVPASASTHVTFGNLTLRTTGRTVRTWCWGLYLSGEQTDAVLQGPTSICELFLWEGRLVVAGDAGTYNSANACTTVEVGHRPVVGVGAAGELSPPESGKRAELVLRNVALGRFGAGDEIVGQITAHRNGSVRIEHARCAPLKLLTRDNGTITLSDVVEQGRLERVEIKE
ncbi:MAG: hypothetical protein FJ276_09735 [Planctomycetes bacterium]|nr:hypothetical protein [Planctomycetota bacterium]